MAQSAQRDTGHFLACLWGMDAALTSAGLPEIPGTWWRREIERFYRSGKRRWVIRKGRRVFASTAIAPRLCVAEILFGRHKHVPGTPPLEYVFISVKREEAAQRLLGVKAVLEALGVECREVGQTIELPGRPAVIKVMTANFRTSVGGTVAFAWCDEVSRWLDGDISKNPAEKIVSSLAPALATLPNAALVLNSSPLSTKDYHAKQYDRGDTDDQVTSFGETWTINPTITEEDTHRLEPNQRAWTREYAAIPVDGVEHDWFGAALDLALVDAVPLVQYGQRPIFCIDPAFARDYFGWAVASAVAVDRVSIASDGEHEPAKGRRVVTLHMSDAWKPDPLNNVGPRELLTRFRDEIALPIARTAGMPTDRPIAVYTDQAEFYSLREVARSLGLTLLLRAWTGGTGEQSKLTTFRAVRTAMHGGAIRIARKAKLVSQFRNVVGTITPAGNERIEYLAHEGAGHLDELSAAVQALGIGLEGVIASPKEKPKQVSEMEKLKNAEFARIEAERKKAWRRSPEWEMRKAMGLR